MVDWTSLVNAVSGLSGSYPRRSRQLEGNHKVFYEAKLVAGEDFHPDNKEKMVSIVKEDNISTLHKLLTVTAWLLRFRDKLTKQSSEEGLLKPPRVKLIWDLFVQDRCYYN